MKFSLINTKSTGKNVAMNYSQIGLNLANSLGHNKGKRDFENVKTFCLKIFFNLIISFWKL